MKKPMKWLFVAIAVVLFGAAFLMLQLIFSASRQCWPTICDQVALLNDAQRITSQTDECMVESNRWTAAIVALKPRFVRSAKGCLEITISTGGINPAWGYLVFPDKRTFLQSGQSIRILKSDGPGIFRYETVE